MIVDEHGYLKLIDFGASKQMPQKSIKRTNTIIGTPHYLAPEIIVG
jgi:serine/threonine protein kinase